MKRTLENTSSEVNAVAKRNILESSSEEASIRPLISALREKASILSIRSILEDMENVNVGYGYYGRTPLHHVVEWNCGMGIFDELISKGADVNMTDRLGMTPLHLAVSSSSKESQYVPKLIALGADVNARNLCGETPLYLAVCQFKKLSIIKMLLENGADTDYVYDDFLTAIGFFTLLEKSVALDIFPAVKLLIKTIFLKNFSKNRSLITELMDDPIYNPKIKYMELCLCELERMQKIKIGFKHSLIDIIQLQKKRTSKTLYSNVLTEVELRKKFSVYQEIVRDNLATALQRGEQIKKFRHLAVWKVSSKSHLEAGGKEVALNFDCIEKICSYLTDQELLNFTKAFQTIFINR